MCSETASRFQTPERGAALVTGSGGGIGRAIAISLSQAGWPVVLMGRRREALESTAESMPGEAALIAGDVRSREEVQAAVSMTESFGGPGLLVNNAAIMPIAPVHRAALEDWADTIDVNVHGVLNMTAAVLPAMRTRGSGHIINISSVAGRQAFPSAAVYSASKSAVDTLTEALRSELAVDAAHGGPVIRVTSIAPGAVDTDLPSSIRDDETRAGVETYYQKMPHVLSPDDVASAVQFAVDAPPHVNINDIVLRPVGMAR
ncbi:MAG: SDR family oxidoreductase [Phycisphaerales bacterium]|nr:SDR family oxidoreductase [Phycisphaerales bacterium]